MLCAVLSPQMIERGIKVLWESSRVQLIVRSQFKKKEQADSLCSQRYNWECLGMKFTRQGNMVYFTFAFSQMYAVASCVIYFCFIRTDLLELGHQWDISDETDLA